MLDEGQNRVIVAITGATGVIYGVRALQMLQRTGIEAHLILSQWGARTLVHETDYRPEDVKRLATRSYQINDLGAVVSSGSFLTRGMLIAPCSVRTLGAIAHGTGDNLIHRAADVILKERRKLVLAIREAPLSTIHLENMTKLSQMGAVISPPVPAFYHRPQTLDEMVDFTVVRLLDQLGIHLEQEGRWEGFMLPGARAGLEE